MKRQKYFLSVVSLIIMVFAVTARAMPADPCTAGWSDSVTQTKFTCTGSDVADWTVRHLAYAFMPMAIGALLFFACPFVFCGRYFCMCCGSSKVRPGYFCCGGSHWDGKPEEERFEAYSQQEVNLVKWGSVVSLIVPVMYFLGAYIGGGLLLSAVQDVVNGALNVVTFLSNDATKFVQALQNADGSYPSAFQSIGTQYTSSMNTLHDIKTNYIHSSIVDQLKGVTAGFAFPTFIPAAFMFVGAIMAVLRIRTCVPMLIVAVLYLLSLPFGCASSLFLIAAAPVEVICAEADAQLGRQPGLFQNYLIPNCDSFNPLAKLNTTVNNAIADVAGDACDSIYDLCDSTTMYVPGSNIYWYCSGVTNCVDLGDVVALNASMELKTGAPNPCTGSTTGACSIDQCQTQCSSTSLRSSASDAVSYISQLNRVNTAVAGSEVLTRYKTCNDFADYLIHSIPLCDNGPSSLELLGAAFMLVVFGNMAGIVFQTLGSKRFIDRERYERGNNSAFGKGHYANLNQGVVVTRNPAYQPKQQDQGGEEMTALDAALL